MKETQETTRSRGGAAVGRWLAVVGAVLVLALLAVPVAEACCRPCQGFCSPKIDPATYCCTGIPEPGNACGFTTCGEYLGGPLPDLEPAEDVATKSFTPAQGLPSLLLPAASPAGCEELVRRSRQVAVAETVVPAVDGERRSPNGR